MPKPGVSETYNKSSWIDQYMEHTFHANNNRKPKFKLHRKEPGEGWISSLRDALYNIDEELSSSAIVGNVNDEKKRNSRKCGLSNSTEHRREPDEDWFSSLRDALYDVDKGLSSSSIIRKVNNKKKWNRRKRALPSSKQQQRMKLRENPRNWYKVTMPFGNNYENEFLFRILSDKVYPLILTQSLYYTSGTEVTFYIEEYELADRLLGLNRTIQMPDGNKLEIKVRRGSPDVEVTTEMKEKMKLAMAKRYNPVTKALDLSRFHSDPNLQEYFCTLFKPNVFSAMVDIIGENIQNVEAINLDNNRLDSIFYTKIFTRNAPYMKILHLGKNNIEDLQVLNNLSSKWSIIDLVLDGNPICGKFKDRSEYISEIRKMFPKLLKLDGVQLEPPISFELEDNVILPSSNQTYLCSNDGQEIVRQFLEPYFHTFDSEERKNLLHAYHEQAVFSTTVACSYDSIDKNASSLSWYCMDNRSLKLCGSLNIIGLLLEMPATKHDIRSFTIDLTFFTPQMISFTVAGIFKEARSGQKQSPLRYFHRTMIIVPIGSRFCITNEILHITNCTDSQAKTVSNIPTVVVQPPTPMISPNASLIEPAQVAAPVAVLNPNLQVQIVQTCMNLEWSRECLEQIHWSFDTA